MRPEKKTLEQMQIPKEETAVPKDGEQKAEQWWEEAQFNDTQQDSQR